MTDRLTRLLFAVCLGAAGWAGGKFVLSDQTRIAETCDAF